MKIKSKGMTLVEVMVSLAVLAIAFGAIYLVFSSSNRTLVDTEIKSQLQHEAQIIQERFSRLGMESTGIETIELDMNGEVKKLAINSDITKKDTKDVIFTSIFHLKDKKLILETLTTNIDGSQAYQPKETVLSENVESLKVIRVGNGTGDIENSESINVEIRLEKTKGRSTKSLDVNTIVTFRNYKPKIIETP